MRSKRMNAATCIPVVGLIPCAFARRSSAAASQAPTETIANPVKFFVDRLDLGRYKATVKGLTKLGHRREGTDRNRETISRIVVQLKKYDCANSKVLIISPKRPRRVSLDPNRVARSGPYLALIVEGRDRIHDDSAFGLPPDCSYP